jgi:hypothetical protein
VELADKIDTENRAEALTEAKRDDFFSSLLMGKDATEEVETSRGKFTVKYPKSADLLTIGKIAAFRRGYKPADAFDAQTDMLNIMASTLDVVVVSGPEWFKNARKAGKDFSFLEVPGREFVTELYGKAVTFRGEVEQRLNTEGGYAPERIPAAEDAHAPVGGGAFGSLASE